MDVEKITPAELEILKVLWQVEEPLTFPQIRERLRKKNDWADSTIQTLLRRLCAKEILHQEKRDLLTYAPLVTEKAYKQSEAKALADRLFHGSARELFAAFISSGSISRQEREELHRLIDEGEQDG